MLFTSSLCTRLETSMRKLQRCHGFGSSTRPFFVLLWSSLARASHRNVQALFFQTSTFVFLCCFLSLRRTFSASRNSMRHRSMSYRRLQRRRNNNTCVCFEAISCKRKKRQIRREDSKTKTKRRDPAPRSLRVERFSDVAPSPSSHCSRRCVSVSHTVGYFFL